MSYIDELGVLGFGSRLKRLSERIMVSAVNVYSNLGFTFEAHWFPLFHYLYTTEKAASVSDLAQSMKYSHPAVIKITNAMIKEQLLLSQGSKTDNRKRMLSLTEKGYLLAKQLEPVWEGFRVITQQLFDEVDLDVIKIIEKLESALEDKAIHERLQDYLEKEKKDIVTLHLYDDQYQEFFKKLNLKWIEKHFTVEETDKKLLMNPKETIVDVGGVILFAEVEGEIVGTGALEKVHECTYMLSKLAVQDEHQGKRIGYKITKALIQKASEFNAQKVVLITDPILEKATKLYQKLGFRECEPDKEIMKKYKRAKSGIFMELPLHQKRYNDGTRKMYNKV